MSDRKFYIKLYKSEECLCGKPKRSKYAFCWGCYRELPPNIKKNLYQSFGGGFEAAVDEAVKHLQTEVW